MRGSRELPSALHGTFDVSHPHLYLPGSARNHSRPLVGPAGYFLHAPRRIYIHPQLPRRESPFAHMVAGTPEAGSRVMPRHMLVHHHDEFGLVEMEPEMALVLYLRRSVRLPQTFGDAEYEVGSMAGEMAMCFDRPNGQGKHENADVSCRATSCEMHRTQSLLLRCGRNTGSGIPMRRAVSTARFGKATAKQIFLACGVWHLA